MIPDERLIVALDVPALAQAEGAMDALAGVVSCFKVGLELFTAEGPAAARAVKARGHRLFLDLKLCDIPNTVAAAVRAAAGLGADLLTVHATGGAAMIAAARAAADVAAREGLGAPRILAVTVLTSLDAAALAAVGLRAPASGAGAAEGAAAAVHHLGRLALSAGAHGLVASPLEAAGLRAELGRDFLLVTPGVRPAGAALGDQARVATPAAALRAGASHLVVGRPLLAAPAPREAALALLAELEDAP